MYSVISFIKRKNSLINVYNFKKNCETAKINCGLALFGTSPSGGKNNIAPRSPITIWRNFPTQRSRCRRRQKELCVSHHFKVKRNCFAFYRGLVRPHPEFSAQFWSPLLRKDNDLFEILQHRATKIIHGFSGQDYKDHSICIPWKAGEAEDM